MKAIKGITGTRMLMAIVALSVAGCSRGIDVRTMSAPDAGFANLRTFRILPGPARRDGRVVRGSEDPMVGNSIANST